MGGAYARNRWYSVPVRLYFQHLICLRSEMAWVGMEADMFKQGNKEETRSGTEYLYSDRFAPVTTVLTAHYVHLFNQRLSQLLVTKEIFHVQCLQMHFFWFVGFMHSSFSHLI